VPATGRVDDHDLAGLVGQVQECVRHARREVGEPALREAERLVADLNLEPSPQDVDGLLLPVMYVQGRPAVRRDLDDEVVEGAAGLVAGDLEDEIAAGPGLKPEPFVRFQNPYTSHSQVFRN
jgi:hypothetical protein